MTEAADDRTDSAGLAKRARARRWDLTTALRDRPAVFGSDGQETEVPDGPDPAADARYDELITLTTDVLDLEREADDARDREDHRASSRVIRPLTAVTAGAGLVVVVLLHSLLARPLAATVLAAITVVLGAGTLVTHLRLPPAGHAQRRRAAVVVAAVGLLALVAALVTPLVSWWAVLLAIAGTVAVAVLLYRSSTTTRE